jgi:hypothetical protein
MFAPHNILRWFEANIKPHVPSSPSLPRHLRFPNGINLDLAGLIALADIRVIANRTVITGSSSPLDILLLAPGIHRQQSACELNAGEYPPTAALTSGYVFRVENQATVRFFQTIGRPGHLTSIVVEEMGRSGQTATKGTKLPFGGQSRCWLHPTVSRSAEVLYLIGPIMTIAVLTLVILIEDWWALVVLAMLMGARLCNTIVIRARSQMGWKGIREPGVSGDLLVLLSQDRWIRIRGLVDDLKAVTSGQWLRDSTNVQEFATGLATVLVYLAVVLATNASPKGSLSILCLMLASAAVLGLSNRRAKTLQMHGRILRVVGQAKSYERRRDLVDELVKETGKDDWAVSLGMISKSLVEGGRSALL